MPHSPGIREFYPELKETPKEDMSQRTKWNVRDSHATLIISPKKSTLSNGTNLTKQTAKEYKRPYLEVISEEDFDKIIDWLNTLGVELTLNIGGPRQSESPEAYQITTNILEKVFKAVNDKKWTKIIIKNYKQFYPKSLAKIKLFLYNENTT